MNMIKAPMAKAAHTSSYYAATANPHPDHPELMGEQDCDVCVIGGGFTGLSSALHLREAGYNVVLLEGQRIGWGASGRNGGLVCTGQRKDPEELEQMLGKTHAHQLWDLAEEAKTLQQDLIKRHAIDCDYHPGIMLGAHKARYVSELEHHVDFMAREYGYDKMTFLDRDAIRSRMQSEMYHGGYLDMGAGHLHPLNYALGLAAAATTAGVRLFENSPATALSTADGKQVIQTAQGQVRARFVVMACNGYLGRLEKRIAPQIMPINNFMIATEPLGAERAEALIRDRVAVDDTKFVVNYYRCSSDSRLLFGGGETYSPKFPADIKGFVRKYMLQIFPQLSDVKIDFGWGGTLAITLNRMPSMGTVDGNIFYAQGFSGQGVLLTTLVGKLIAEAVSGTAERFDVMARVPSPKFPGGMLLRYPGLVAGMLYYSLRDRI